MSPPPSDKLAECHRAISDKNVKRAIFSLMCRVVPLLRQHRPCLSMKPQLDVIHLRASALPGVLRNKYDLSSAVWARALLHFTSVLGFVAPDHTYLSLVRLRSCQKVSRFIVTASASMVAGEMASGVKGLS